MPKSVVMLLLLAMTIAGCSKKITPTQPETTATPVITIEMITIPAGIFTMGGDSSDIYGLANEFPKHSVYLRTYRISKNLITNAQYKLFMDAGGYMTSSFWSDSGWTWRQANTITEPLYWSSGQYNSGSAFPNYPVAGVSWFEADAFCRWAGYRLPTEAEWEKAARGTSQYLYPWGGVWDSTKCNGQAGREGFDTIPDAPPDTFTYSSPVGFFSAGMSPYGLYDMAGNVWEWVNDRYQYNYYIFSPDSNPTGPTAEYIGSRVVRGGSWSNGFIGDCRTSMRGHDWCAYRHEDYGFRVAR